MKNTILLILMALLLSSCFVGSTLIFTESDIGDSVNLVANPGFAAYSYTSEEALKGWSIYTTPEDKSFDRIRIDPVTAIEGETSLRIDASDKDVFLISDSFKVRRYGGYYSRIKVHSDSKQPPNLRFSFTTFKDDGKITNRFHKRAKFSKEWNPVSVSAGFLRPGVSFGRISVLIPAFSDGSIWIDDAGCWEVHGFRID